MEVFTVNAHVIHTEQRLIKARLSSDHCAKVKELILFRFYM